LCASERWDYPECIELHKSIASNRRATLKNYGKKSIP
jgi:hypothetical protein